MYSYGPQHMAVQKQDDQHEHTFSIYVRIRDVVLKTCLGRWTIGRSGERGSGISVLPARHDDDDDDIYIYIYIYIYINPRKDKWWSNKWHKQRSDLFSLFNGISTFMCYFLPKRSLQKSIYDIVEHIPLDRDSEDYYLFQVYCLKSGSNSVSRVRTRYHCWPC